jgi:hypothetical protein
MSKSPPWHTLNDISDLNPHLTIQKFKRQVLEWANTPEGRKAHNIPFNQIAVDVKLIPPSKMYFKLEYRQ